LRGTSAHSVLCLAIDSRSTSDTPFGFTLESGFRVFNAYGPIGWVGFHGIQRLPMPIAPRSLCCPSRRRHVNILAWAV
jgi:hypothetical protein